MRLVKPHTNDIILYSVCDFSSFRTAAATAAATQAIYSIQFTDDN